MSDNPNHNPDHQLTNQLVVLNRKSLPDLYHNKGYIYYIYRVKSVYSFGGDDLAECYAEKPLPDKPPAKHVPENYRCNFNLEHIVPLNGTNKLYGSLFLDKGGY